MKKIVVLFCFLLLYACNENKSKKDLNNNSTQININIDNSLTNVYLKKSQSGSNYLLPKKLKIVYLDKGELNCLIKENTFVSFYDNYKYYLLKEYNFNNFIYKVILFNSFVDNDAYSFNVVLFSYSKNKLVDAIMLDCRTDIENEFFSNFKIVKDMIYIEKVELDLFNYDEGGNILNEKRKPDTIKTNIKYKILKDGHFEKTI